VLRWYIPCKYTIKQKICKDKWPLCQESQLLGPFKQHLHERAGQAAARFAAPGAAQCRFGQEAIADRRRPIGFRIRRIGGLLREMARSPRRPGPPHSDTAQRNMIGKAFSLHSPLSGEGRDCVIEAEASKFLGQ
jgi:hypothetical protein